jgi:hypothetical protein
MDGAEKPFCHPKHSSVSTFQAYNIILIGRSVQAYNIIFIGKSVQTTISFPQSKLQ